MRRRQFVGGLLLAPLAACGRFGNRDTAEPPAELVEFESTLTVRRLWNARIGRGAEGLRLGLLPATDGARIYAGAHDGQAAAYDAVEGQRIWAVRTGLALGGGPAVGDGRVVFGTTDGDLVALDAQNGATLWRQYVGSEVLAPPATGSGVIVVRSVDGRLRGFAGTDGRPLWTIEQSVPALTLRGNAAPVIAGPVVVCGFDNGRLGAYQLATGAVLWELPVATPSGRTELERLVDVSAGLRVVGNDVYAAGYHGRVVGVALETGMVLWQQELSSYAGLGADWNNIYVTDELSAVTALDRRNGAQLWRQEALRLRDVTAPTAHGAAGVVVGDLEGYLHWLAPDDGRFLARQRVARARITRAPVLAGQNLFAQAEDSTVAGFSIVTDED